MPLHPPEIALSTIHLHLSRLNPRRQRSIRNWRTDLPPNFVRSQSQQYGSEGRSGGGVGVHLIFFSFTQGSAFGIGGPTYTSTRRFASRPFAVRLSPIGFDFPGLSSMSTSTSLIRSPS